MRGSQVLALMASVSAVAIAAPAFADEAPAQATTVQEVIVTAQKKAEPLKNVPMSVTALAGAQLEKVQATEFSDYAAFVPGLTLESSGPGITRLTLRGQNAGSDGSNVAVYVDDTPFGSSNALLNGSILTGDLNTYDLQRLEVLRGPQGTLYGANSEGGLLKFVFNPPVLGAYQGGFQVTGETVDHGNTGGSVNGMINVPLGDIAAFRISGFDEYVPGYVSDPLTHEKNINSGNRNGAHASILIKPSDNLTIQLSALAQRTAVNGSSSIDVQSDTDKSFYPGAYSQGSLFPQPRNFEYENYAATIDWNLGPVTLTSVTSYGVMNTNQVVDATNAVAAPAINGHPAVTYPDALFGGSSLFTVGETNDSVLDKFTQEIRLAGGSSDKLEWLVGGYYTHEEGALHQRVFVVDTPTQKVDNAFGSLETVLLSSVYQEYAGFGDLTYHFNSQFDVQVGARYSHNTQSATEALGGPLACGAKPSPCQSFSTPSSGDVFTWSVAPRWHIDANTMAYARVATGFRPGGPNPLPPVAPPSVPREFGSDSTTNYEVGIRSTQLDGKLSLDIAAFYVDWKNIQLLVNIDNFGIDGNGGRARTDGVEWSTAYVPIPGLTLSWSGALTQSNLTEDAPGVLGVSGDRLPFVPHFSTTLDADYEWHAWGDYKAFVGATWVYVGDRMGDFESAMYEGTTAMPHPGQFVGQAYVPSYNTLAARIGVEDRRWRFEVWGKNMLNSRGIVAYGDGEPGMPGSMAIIEPMTVGFTISAKFH